MEDLCLFQQAAQRVEAVRVDLARLAGAAELLQQGQMLEERRVTRVGQGEFARMPVLRQQAGRELLRLDALDLVPQHIEEQGMMRGDHCLDAVILAAQELAQMVSHGDRVLLVQRRNEVVDDDCNRRFAAWRGVG